MKTSFHISGFWFYVTWDAKGEVGRDQHGRTWFNQQKPYTLGHHVENVCRISRDAIIATAQKLKKT